MKRLGVACREKIIDEIEQRYSGSNACLFIGLNKLGAFDVNLLRNDLRSMDTQIMLSKNTLIKRAMEKLGREEVDEFLNESTGMVFINSDAIAEACKKLVDFSKEKEGAITVKGGYLDEKKLAESDVVNLAKLPPKPVLLGMAVSAIASPLTGFLSAMKQVPQKFVWAVEEIKKKKSEKE